MRYEPVNGPGSRFMLLIPMMADDAEGTEVTLPD